MNAEYFDIADDGTLVRGAGVESGGDAFVQFGHDVPIGVPVYVRNLVTRRDAGACAFKGQDGRCYTVSRSGHVEVRGAVYGDEAVAFTPDGRLVFVIDPGDRQPCVEYSVGGVRQPIPAHRIGTGQGILEAYDDGSVKWVDDCFATPLALRTFGGIEFNKWRTRGPWTFGLSQIGCALYDALANRVSVYPEANRTSWTLRGAVVDGELLVVSSQPGLLLGPDAWVPYVPAAEPPVVTPPVVTPPVPQEPPVSAIPHSEIVAVTAQAKAEVESLGYTFWVKRDVDDYYKIHGTTPDPVKQMGMLVTIHAAWELHRRYPAAGIGLEAYDGFSGVPSPFPGDGPTTYAFDIVLLSKEGPSVDILAGGVDPVAQVDSSTAATTREAWKRDWRPPLNPYRGTEPVTPPVVDPPPVDPPAPPQTTPPALVEALAAIESRLDAIDRVMEAVAQSQVAIREALDRVPEPPVYTGTVAGRWPLGTVSVRLTPEAD